MWTYYQITERNRIKALRDRIDAVNVATLNAAAFNDPQKLVAERDAALAAARSTPVTKAKDDAEWRAAAERLTKAVEQGQLLNDTPNA